MTHPAIRDLFQSLARDPSFQEAVSRLTRDPLARQSLAGLTTTAKALYIVLLWQATERNIVVVVDGNKQAEALGELIDTFFDLLVTSDLPKPQTIPALDVLPAQRMSPHSEISAERAIGLWRLASGKASRKTSITITPVASALLRTEGAEFYRQLALTLRVGEEIPLEDLLSHLTSIGYEKRDPVEMVGEYSLRGGILDIFPAEAQKPIRIELFGDLIESIRRFDVETQRSVMKISEATLLPLAEYPKSRELFAELAEQMDVASPGDPFPGWEFAVPLVRPRKHSLFSLTENPLVVVDEPERVAGASERLWKRLEEKQAKPLPFPPDANFFAWPALREALAGNAELLLRELDLATPSQSPIANSSEAPAETASRPSLAFHGNIQAAIAEARNLVERGYRVVFFARSSGELERLADIFQEYQVPFQLGLDPADATRPYLAERSYVAGAAASTFLVKGLIRRGVVFPEAQIAVFGSEDLFDSSDLVAKPSSTKSQLAAFTTDIADLKPGDFVVHESHGIGRFVGTREIAQGDNKGDFMLLEYAADAKLYVPLARLDLIQKYRGAGEGAAPALDRLGGVTWEKTKTRVKAKMRDMADELLKLYAQRRMAEGFSYSADSNWQREFEDAFEFTETKDQLSAIKQIKKDMESGHPMDRLLCGDVGYGKTEVAMRATFKALGDGKQTAVLAPTTVLAYQHFETFKRRFAAFPVRIEMLSRFRDKKQIAEVLEGLADGKVDVVIGTHRILSQDVQFRDLGLLVVDEEQRFGVRHKERIKQLKHNVDVLTMSATPIPRTLHMSLAGLRDMSVIETPPKDRLAIHTVVAHYNNDLIKTAIEQEIARGGQVYFIHNRVDSIYMRASSIQELLPDVRVGVGHGQMTEGELERALLGFMRHDFDVFVCTTIAENGLDIPLANTMIIEHAERYGLSELYQLRGRVGRSNRRAYAYLLVPEGTELSEIARKRLAALKEFSDLGAGFKIAALDLELRGAGNILGGEQHGHIGAVGFDMYIRLLEETVHELKGEAAPLQVHSTLNLGLDIRIPSEYISDEHQRLRAYKKIADSATAEAAAEALASLEDRYGPAPEAIRNLLKFSALKGAAQALGIEAIDRRAGALNVKFHKDAHIDPTRLMALVTNTEGAQFTPAGVLRLPLDGAHDAGRVLDLLEGQLKQLGKHNT
ncbi:MAG TPA: transcription-repair coupling factor [Bryobacteraceae bacterium]|nr:transcription-repair coupling factor [Bryobacteraceae bacterium]